MSDKQDHFSRAAYAYADAMLKARKDGDRGQ